MQFLNLSPFLALTHGACRLVPNSGPRLRKIEMHRLTVSSLPSLVLIGLAMVGHAFSADTTQAKVDTAKLAATQGAVDTTKAAVDTARATVNAAPAIVDTLKAVADTHKVVADTNKVAIDTNKVVVDTAKVASDTVKIVIDSAKAKTDTAQASVKKPKRQRVVRETSVNTLDELKGRYRSPKTALFLSLLIPGAGQAYVGGTAFNYARAVSYLAIDISLGAAWYHYVKVKHDRQVKRYRRFADTTWSIKQYEDSLFTRYPSQVGQAEAFFKLNFARSYYCYYIVNPDASPASKRLYDGCVDYENDSTDASLLRAFVNQFDDSQLSPEQIAEQRAGFNSTFDFYEIIGKEQEFLVGWKDVQNVAYLDTGIVGQSDYRDAYVSMRQKAERYSKMQAYFIGGILANHIISAIDAALAARYHNHQLYQTETAWFDRIRLNSDFAFTGTDMHSWVGASFSF